MIRYLKIWIEVIKNTLDIRLLSMVFSFYLILFFAVYFFVSHSVMISLVITLLVIIIRQSIKLFMFYKDLIAANQFGFILLKPIDSLVGLIVYNKDPLDIFILLPIIVFVRFKKNK